MTPTRLFFIGLVVSLTAACGSGSGSDSSDAAANSPPESTGPELDALTPAQVIRQVDSGDTVSQSIAFRNIGSEALTYDLTTSAAFITIQNGSGSVAAGSATTVTIVLTCSGANENGQVTLDTNDADAPAVAIPVNVTCVAPPSYDIARVVFNQAARSFDSAIESSPRIATVAGREMLVRAFITGQSAVPNAEVVIINGANEQAFAMQTPPSISATPADESILSAGHYAVIPGSALSVGDRLYVRIVGANDRYPETGSVDLRVTDPGPFNVTFVPVQFTTGTPSINGEQYLRQTIQQLPVGEYDIEIRAPYVFSGPYDLDDLLEEMSELRTLDGSPRLYHGIIIPETSGSQTAGLGYVGYPVSVSVDLFGSQNIIAHEIGHNLNLSHAPACDPPDPDPDFPYADGIIPGWGYDVVNNRLVAPSATLTDLMGYCSDVWISDYHFAQSLDHRVANPLGRVSEPSLLIRGTIASGQVTGVRMLPVPQGTEETVPGEIELTFRNASGQVIGTGSSPSYEIGDRYGHSAFQAVVTADLSQVHTVEVKSQGRVLFVESYSAQEPGRVQARPMPDGGVQLNWSAGNGAALIARDDQGQVVAIDRHGSLTLDQWSGGTSIEIASPGMVQGTRMLSDITRDGDWLLVR